MPQPANTNTARTSDSPLDDADLSAEERRRIVKYGIGFDGRYYRYGEYRYDRLSDALNYAELDGARSPRPTLKASPEWREPHRPTVEEQALMERFAVTFDGKFYLFEGYRYDRCSDAVNYARSRASNREA